MAGLGNQQDDQPLNESPALSNDTPESQVPIEMSMLTINVFFDGTANNQFNTNARLKGEHTELDEEVSYNNYYSNVAILEMACTDNARVKKIYIQGSGTRKHATDKTIGLAFSNGATGVYSRVKEAFKLIEGIRIGINPARITLNVFGFSRGSFFARYFCAMAKLKYVLDFSDTVAIADSGRDQLKFDADNISINLVGLYDTVSSEGFIHDNDVKPFRLNIGTKQKIRKIVHLTAENDYRNHFPLTRVNTAAGQGVAFECRLPGAHSDIGGSYCVDAKEEQYLSVFSDAKGSFFSPSHRKSGELSWRWYKEKGYYQGDPIEKQAVYGEFRVKQNYVGREYHSHYFTLFAKRQFSSNSYQFIPLELMKTIAEREAQIVFTKGGGKEILEGDIASVGEQGGVLKKFRDYAYQYVMDNYQQSGLNFKVLADSALSVTERKELYNRYIHNSLDADSIANGSNSENEGGNRIIINDS